MDTVFLCATAASDVNGVADLLQSISSDPKRAAAVIALLLELIPLIIYAQGRTGWRRRLEETARWVVYQPYKMALRATRKARRQPSAFLQVCAAACIVLVRFIYGDRARRWITVSIVLSLVYMTLSFIVSLSLWPSLWDARALKLELEQEVDPLLSGLGHSTISAATEVFYTQYQVIHPYEGELPEHVQARIPPDSGIQTWDDLRHRINRFDDDFRVAVRGHEHGRAIGVLTLLEGTSHSPGPQILTLGGLLALNILYDLLGLGVMALGGHMLVNLARDRHRFLVASILLCATAVLFVAALLLYGPFTLGDPSVAAWAGGGPLLVAWGLIAIGLAAGFGYGIWKEEGWMGSIMAWTWAVPIGVFWLCVVVATIWITVARFADIRFPPIRSGGELNLLPWTLAASCCVPLLLFSGVIVIASVIRLLSGSSRRLILGLLRAIRRQPTPTYFVLTSIPAACSATLAIFL